MKIYNPDEPRISYAEQLEKTEANLAAIVNNADGIIYSIDKDFRYITLNNTLKDILKEFYGIDAKPGDKIYDFMENSDPKEAKKWKSIYSRAFYGEQLRFIKEFNNFGNTTVWSFSINPILQNEIVTGLACFGRDITELHTAQAELQKSLQQVKTSEEWFRQATQNPTLGIEWVSPEGKILSANEGLCSMLGYPLAELLGTHFSKITYPEDSIHEALLFEKMRNGEIDTCLIEKRYITKQQKLIWAELNLSCARDVEGTLQYFVGVIQNISARKGAENELKALNESLEKKVMERTSELVDVNRQLESYSYSVSHDLRSPIRSIQGFAQLLQKKYGDKLDETGKELIFEICNNTRKMQVLIEDLLTFSRLGKKTIEKVDVDMADLAKSAWINEMGPLLKKPVLKMDLQAHVKGDKAMLKQVWVNLIGNATKYSSKEEHPIIEIGAEETENEIIFSVKDNGAGFDMKYIDKLFGAFQRLHSPREFEGNGVGLAIVKQIIEKHGGRVWAEGEVDVGATFYFSLPKTN